MSYDHEYDTAEVCVDCVSFLEGYDVDNADWDYDLAEENLGGIGHVTSLYYDEDGVDDFSYSLCYGCNTTVGGTRYKVAVWDD